MEDAPTSLTDLRLTRFCPWTAIWQAAQSSLIKSTSHPPCCIPCDDTCKDAVCAPAGRKRAHRPRRRLPLQRRHGGPPGTSFPPGAFLLHSTSLFALQGGFHVFVSDSVRGRAGSTAMPQAAHYHPASRLIRSPRDRVRKRLRLTRMTSMAGSSRTWSRCRRQRRRLPAPPVCSRQR